MNHEGEYACGMWIVVILNIAIFLFFLGSFLIVEWRNLGALSAFLVALFIEMYGFPLTIYYLTSLLGKYYPVVDPFTHKHGHLFAVFLGGGTSKIC